MNGHTWRLTATDADADTATLDFLARIVPDRTPSFGDAAIGDQAWIENAAITAFDLPEATGGNGDLTYTLAPALPGGVSRAGRRVSGTPGAAMARTQYTWTATDADGDQAALTFHVTVAADRAPSFGEATISDLSWLQGSPITEVTLPEATGGNAPLTYGIATPGSTRVGTQGLPQGIELDGRVLKGTPTQVQESSDVDYAWLVVDADGRYGGAHLRHRGVRRPVAELRRRDARRPDVDATPGDYRLHPAGGDRRRRRPDLCADA